MNPSCPAGQYGMPSVPLIGCVDPKNPLELLIFGGIALAVFAAPGIWKVAVPAGLLLLRSQLSKVPL
jgi:hypothetical protein